VGLGVSQHLSSADHVSSRGVFLGILQLFPQFVPHGLRLLHIGQDFGEGQMVLAVLLGFLDVFGEGFHGFDMLGEGEVLFFETEDHIINDFRAVLGVLAGTQMGDPSDGIGHIQILLKFL
jgi:hypothetical protein